MLKDDNGPGGDRAVCRFWDKIWSFLVVVKAKEIRAPR